MNTFYLKFLILTLTFSIHGMAGTPDDEDNKKHRGTASSAASDAGVERMRQAIRRAQASYGPLSYCLPSGAIASDRSAVAVASDAPTDRKLATMTQEAFVRLLYKEMTRESDKEGGKTYRGAVSSASDDGRKKAIPLDFESHHPVAVAVASNAPAVAVASDAAKQCEWDAELLALLPPEEAAEQARLLAHYAAEKATDDFLRAEREEQLAAYLA